jgi:hypothetical protein
MSRTVRSTVRKLPAAVKPVDLRKITHGGSECYVALVDAYGRERVSWLALGLVDFQELEHCREWLLRAALKHATDEEHDPAYALRLPVVGLKFEQLWDGRAHFTAWVADDPDEFRVPPPGYDPRDNTRRCDECDPKHLFAPYLPDHDPDLFQEVKGLRLEISVGPPVK